MSHARVCSFKSAAAKRKKYVAKYKPEGVGCPRQAADGHFCSHQSQMRSFFVSSKATELSTEVMTAEARFAHSPKKATWDYVRERV